MALQTATYSDLILDIQANAGNHSGYGTKELASIKRLINQRARKALRSSPMWERWLVIGEERAVDDSAAGHVIVPYTGPAYDASSSYQPYNGVIDEGYRVHPKVPWDTVSSIEYQFQGASSGLRLQNYSASYGLSVNPTHVDAQSTTYSILIGSQVDAFVGGKFKLDGWTDFGSGVPDGEYTILSVVYTAAGTTITATGVNYSTLWFGGGDETMTFPSAFATYKKRLDVPYGDESGDTTTIPLEWAEYISFGVAADLARGDGQFGGARELEAVAIDSLTDELAKLDSMHTAETVFKRHRTHGSEARQSVTVS